MKKFAWSTKDILVAGMIGIVFAFVLLGVTYGFFMIGSLLGPAFARAVNGIWLIPGFMAMYLIRKPGVGFVAQCITGFVMSPFSPYGWTMIFWQAFSGVMYEIPFLLFLYKKYTTSLLLIAGSILGVLSTLFEYPIYGLALLSIPVQVTMLVVSAVSGLLGGWLSKLLADSVMKTGLLAEYNQKNQVVM